MIILCREQKTSEWHGLRCGRVTASNMWRAMNVVEKGSKVRGDKRWESGAERKKYIRELAWELITHTPTEHYVTEAMDLGNQFESQARTEYWMTLGQEVDQTGLVRHPTLPFVAASPDGLVGDTGGVEIKVPLLATHQQTLIDDAIPEKYVLQMQANMMCCEREWWDFVSYAPPDLYPELPEEFRLYVKRLPADPAMHREMEEAATATMEQAAALVKQLSGRYLEAAPKESKSAFREQLEVSVSMEDAADFIEKVTELARVP